MLSAILLAAGSSRRMGSVNKLLLPWQDKTILHATTSHLLAAGIDDIIVVTGHEADATRAAIGSLPVRIVHNPHYATGMTSSIQAGVHVAIGDGYMICLADMVMITPNEYTLLKISFKEFYSLDDRCILLPEFRGKKGNPVIFSSTYYAPLMEHPDAEGCKSLVLSHPNHHWRVTMPTDHILRDLDTPEDYRQLTAQPK